jgi:hypothetical protein
MIKVPALLPVQIAALGLAILLNEVFCGFFLVPPVNARKVPEMRP